MKMILFPLAVLGVFYLLNMYISKRLVTKLDLSENTKKQLRIFLIINYVGVVLYVLARYYVNYPSWLYFVVSLPLGILFLFFCTALIYDVSRILLKLVPLSNKRRDFFKKSLDISSLVFASAVSARSVQEALEISHQKVQIQLKNLKQEYTVVQLSDIHIGGLVDAKYIKHVVEKVNEMSADIIVITGDLIDIKVEMAYECFKLLQQMKSKYGTYYVVGNHEYFHGIEEIIYGVKGFGIRVLENENVYIGDENKGFNLAGVHDVFGYRAKKYLPDIHKAMVGLKDSPTVLLAHQPRFIHEVPDGIDLILSGHTHGGQLYPFKLLVKMVQPYISGLHKHNDNMQIYVNRGTGFWGPPMRLGAKAEITEITLVASS